MIEPEAHARYGVVLIGRNEGERLKRCIASVSEARASIVYVDSGSTDGSPGWACENGADVVSLDMNLPFTAARARNAGFQRLRSIAPNVEFVQFVDGDCEVVGGWIDSALQFLLGKENVAAVCGRRRERQPNRSPYNLLCDMEWNTPVGQARSCGGDVMMRTTAFVAAGGYRDDLIAGEEPELCVRLRALGWCIWRLPLEMTLHDAGITKFGQWWKRAKRGGHAFAEGAYLHGAPPERHGVAQTSRALVWGALIPMAIIVLGAGINAWWFLLLLLYPLQVLRLALRDNIADPSRRLRALFFVLARFPEAQGVLQFAWNRVNRKRSALIEYK